MKAVRIIGILCIFLGMLVFLTPQIQTIRLQMELRSLQHIEVTEETKEAAPDEAAGETEAIGTESAAPDEHSPGREDLYTQMKAFNQKLYEEGQKIAGPEDYEQNPVGEEGPIGSIRIPDMNVELPLYIGATYEHLDKGAAVLGGTSMPVGGQNTNCVVSGHRSWCGAPYFRDIDLLKPGSEVVIDNGKETLHYKAFEQKIILPADTEEIMIRPGKDLVTLITCHPYLGGGTHRYVVYCERCKEESNGEISANRTLSHLRDDGAAKEEDAPAVTGREEKMEEMIRTEIHLRRLMTGIIAAGIILLVLRRGKRVLAKMT